MGARSRHTGRMRLGQLLQQLGPVPPALAAPLVTDIAVALDRAHGQGLVHGNVSPWTIEIYGHDTPTPAARLTDPTPDAPPDQWSAPERGTAAGDVYSLGLVLWSCLSGRPPYAEGGAVPLTGLDRRLAGVVAQATAADPDLRGTAAELAMALAAPAPPGTGVRTAVVVGAAVVALVAAAGTTWAVVAGRDDPPAQSSDEGDEGDEGDEVRASTDGDGGGSGRAAAVLGDVDGDRLGDLRLLHDGQLVTYQGGAAGMSESHRAYVDPIVDRALGCDVDFDGTTDTILLRTEQFRASRDFGVTVLTADGEQFETSYVFPAGASTATHASPVCGDFTGDGPADLAFGFDSAPGTGTVWVMPGLPSGVFGEPQPWGARPDRDTSVDALIPGDFDGDGDADLAVLDGPSRKKYTEYRDGPARLQLLQSDGSRFYLAEPLALTDSWFSFWDVLAGDVDGDHTDELVVATHENELRSLAVHQLVGNAFDAGVPWGEEPMPDPETYVNSVLSDMDGDGDGDLVSLRTAVSDEYAPIMLRRSTGSTFEPPAEVARYFCRGPCEPFTIDVVKPSAW